MSSQRMIRILAIVLERDNTLVTKTLLQEGILHLIHMTKIKAQWMEKLQSVESQSRLAKLIDTRKRIENSLHSFGLSPRVPDKVDVSQYEHIDLDKSDEYVSQIADRVQNIRDNQKTHQQEILKYQDIQKQISMYGFDFSEAVTSSKFSYISLIVGVTSREKIERLRGELKDIPSIIEPIGQEKESVHFLILSLKRDRDNIIRLLQNIGWSQLEFPEQLSHIEDNVLQNIDHKVEQLNSEQQKLQASGEKFVQENHGRLSDIWLQLRVHELIYKMQSFFKRSSRSILFTGWLPFDKKEHIEKQLRAATDGRIYVEWIESDKSSDLEEGRETAPVRLKNPKLLAPFQMLVTNYGIPAYGTIDPTPVVVIFYLLMYGLMFADAGQGAIIVGLGLAGYFSFRDKKESFRNLSSLLIWCGASSILFGILFGSYFGVSWFKPLWFDYHGIVTGSPHTITSIRSVTDILTLTIYFGISVIGVGLVFNWINLILSKQWLELILAKGGIVGGWIYAGGIYTAYYMVDHDYKGLPDALHLFLCIGLPALLLFFKSPIHHYLSRPHGSHKGFAPMSLVNLAMEGIVELLEVFTGYLSNTLSFMRVAGLGIAHVSLMISFFTLARMANGGNESSSYNLWAILIIMIGNVLVIALEGLSAGIQALRLHYYEFFTKFFHGTGKLYSPISIQSKE